jgi:hypothetical protein
MQHFVRWAQLGSNQRPPACEAGALPLSYAPKLGAEDTSGDATYIALSEALKLPFLTTDRALAGATGHRARVVAFPDEG